MLISMDLPARLKGWGGCLGQGGIHFTLSLYLYTHLIKLIAFVTGWQINWG